MCPPVCKATYWITMTQAYQPRSHMCIVSLMSLVVQSASLPLASDARFTGGS